MGLINYLIHSLTTDYLHTQGNIKQTAHLKQQKGWCFGYFQVYSVTLNHFYLE